MKNIRIDSSDNSILLNVNSAVYPLDVIFSVSYIFIEDNYIVLDKEKDNILVQIKPKNRNNNLNRLAGKFFNELATYTEYKNQLGKNRHVRDDIIKKVLLSNVFEKSDNLRNMKFPWENDKDIPKEKPCKDPAQ